MKMEVVSFSLLDCGRSEESGEKIIIFFSD